MLLKDFFYELPPEFIAQKPLPRRSASKLMIVERQGKGCKHDLFNNISGYLKTGDCIVVNASKVIPARLFMRRKTGGRIEVLYVRKRSGKTFQALLKPMGRIKIGEVLLHESKDFGFRVLARINPREMELEIIGNDNIEQVLEKYGHVPLPPYINRPDEIEDISRYQTVYAREKGSVAAPTAGLHFDTDVLSSLQEKGVKVLSVVLHVGPGTFLPLESEDVAGNRLLSETFRIDGSTLVELKKTQKRGGRVVAVGTTVTRVLEASYKLGLFESPSGGESYQGETDLFIYPGFEFKVVDCLLTNFHLPASSLLLLVCAFLGRERTLACYEEALQKGYRFYSYGDAMLIT